MISQLSNTRQGNLFYVLKMETLWYRNGYLFTIFQFQWKHQYMSSENKTDESYIIFLI